MSRANNSNRRPSATAAEAESRRAAIQSDLRDLAAMQQAWLPRAVTATAAALDPLTGMITAAVEP